MDIDVMGRHIRELMDFKVKVEEFMERSQRPEPDAEPAARPADPDKPLEHIAEVEASLDATEASSEENPTQA